MNISGVHSIDISPLRPQAAMSGCACAIRHACAVRRPVGDGFFYFAYYYPYDIGREFALRESRP